MFFNAVTSLLMHSFVPGAVGCSGRQAEDRGTGPAPASICSDVLLFTGCRLYLVQVNRWRYSAGVTQCLVTREAGWRGNSIRWTKGVWHGAKEKERGSGEGNGDGLRNVRYRVLTVSAALCCFVGLLLPSASYAGDAGLAALIRSSRSHPYEEPAYLLLEPEAAHTPFTVPPAFLLFLSELVTRRPQIQLAW